MTRSLPTHQVFLSGTPQRVIFSLLLVLVLCCSPSLAEGYTYLDPGIQPALSAHAEGDTRYYPGDTFAVTILLTNKGKETSMQVAPLQSPGIYDPSTALGVTVRPRAGDAPVTLKSLPTVAGDVGSWDQVPVMVRGTVHQNASPGIYVIPLDVNYQYVYAIPMVGEDFGTVDMLYRAKAQTLPVTIRVLGEVRPSVIRERSENLVPGTQGYLTAEVENTGYEDGSEVTFHIVPADNSTFQMVDESVYIGRFGQGAITPVRARIAVRENTGAGSYPAVLTGEYRDADGIFRSTRPVPLGIPVARGAVIDALTKNLTIAPGGKQTISVLYTNTGDTPARDAAARIIGSQVLVTDTDTAMLGTLAPHESRMANYVISAGSAITGKQYVIDTEVKYRDTLDNVMLSDKVSFGVDVQNPSGISAVTSNPVILIVIAGILAIFAYGVWEFRRRKR